MRTQNSNAFFFFIFDFVANKIRLKKDYTDKLKNLMVNGFQIILKILRVRLVDGLQHCCSST